MNKKNSSKVIFTTFLTLLLFTAHDQSMASECLNKKYPGLFDENEKGRCASNWFYEGHVICLDHLPNDKFSALLEASVRDRNFPYIRGPFAGKKQSIYADYYYDSSGNIPTITDFPDLSHEQKQKEHWPERGWENKKRLWKERAPYLAATAFVMAGATALCAHLRSRNMVPASLSPE